MAGFQLALVDWARHGPALAAVRHAVFVIEQGVPEQLEWDGLDPECRHAAAFAADGQVIGTGRLLPDGRIGRMAVLAAWRRRGVGAALLRLLLAEALGRGDRHIHLHAQVDAVAFYERSGFVASGADFLDAGIVHRSMSFHGDASTAVTSTRQS
ncbi:MAG: GNAT family N-acetyltransferase [Pseudomonadota bacterium]|nr:GNAT family N-acetyltransferase [Pseudomonadota bacterium]